MRRGLALPSRAPSPADAARVKGTRKLPTGPRLSQVGRKMLGSWGAGWSLCCSRNSHAIHPAAMRSGGAVDAAAAARSTCNPWPTPVAPLERASPQRRHKPTVVPLSRATPLLRAQCCHLRPRASLHICPSELTLGNLLPSLRTMTLLSIYTFHLPAICS